MTRIPSGRPMIHLVRLAPIAGILVALAACAPQPFADDGLVKRSASIVRAAALPGETKDFVENQRPPKLDYVPVGLTPPRRPVRARDAAGAAALAAELDAQRQQSRSFADRPKPKATYDGSVPPRPVPPPKELMPQ